MDGDRVLGDLPVEEPVIRSCLGGSLTWKCLKDCVSLNPHRDWPRIGHSFEYCLAILTGQFVITSSTSCNCINGNSRSPPFFHSQRLWTSDDIVSTYSSDLPPRVSLKENHAGSKTFKSLMPSLCPSQCYSSLIV